MRLGCIVGFGECTGCLGNIVDGCIQGLSTVHLCGAATRMIAMGTCGFHASWGAGSGWEI